MKFLVAIFLLGVIIVSGCSRSINNQTLPSGSSVLVDVCAGGSGNVTEYTLDIDTDSLKRVDAVSMLTAKCNVFAKCKFDNEGKIFKLYAKEVTDDSEKKIFSKVNFTASLALISETDANGKTTLLVEDKTYEMGRNDTEKAVEIEGKIVRLGQSIELNGYNLQLFEYRDNPTFLIPVVGTNDVVGVDLNSNDAQVFKESTGFGRFSIPVQISNSSAKKISNIAKNMRSVINFESGEANLNAKIYYYFNNNLLSIVQLPAKIKEISSYPYIIIQSVEDSYLEAVKRFNWMSSGLKVQTYPEIKILETKSIDCRDVI